RFDSPMVEIPGSSPRQIPDVLEISTIETRERPFPFYVQALTGNGISTFGSGKLCSDRRLPFCSPQYQRYALRRQVRGSLHRDSREAPPSLRPSPNPVGNFLSVERPGRSLEIVGRGMRSRCTPAL